MSSSKKSSSNKSASSKHKKSHSQGQEEVAYWTEENYDKKPKHKKKKEKVDPFEDPFKHEKKKKKHSDKGKKKHSSKDSHRSELKNKVAKTVLGNLQKEKKAPAPAKEEDKYAKFLSTLKKPAAPAKHGHSHSSSSEESCPCADSSPSCPSTNDSSSCNNCDSESPCDNSDSSSECPSSCEGPPGPPGIPGTPGLRGPAGPEGDPAPFAQILNAQSGPFTLTNPMTFPYQLAIGPGSSAGAITGSTVPNWILLTHSVPVTQTANVRQLVVNVGSLISQALSADTTFNLTVTLQYLPSTFGVATAPVVFSATPIITAVVPITVSSNFGLYPTSSISASFGPWDGVVINQGDNIVIQTSLQPTTIVATDQPYITLDVSTSLWLNYEGSV